MQISTGTLITSWAQECGRGFPFPPPENFSLITRPLALGGVSLRRWNRENPLYQVRVAENGALTVTTVGRGTQTVVELGRHLRLKKNAKPVEEVVLLNGDGFDDRRLQQLQAQVRNAVSNRFVRHYDRMVVPYAALQAASLDLSSIVPIHISMDRNTSNVVNVPTVPKEVLDGVKKPTATELEQRYGQTINEFTYGRHEYRHVVRHYQPTVFTLMIMHHAEFSPAAAWHLVNMVEDQWTVTEAVHRLGESVFRATGADGETHRWISGFDQQENPAMYYLAQLPDGGGIRYVTHAVKALAPPIVHRARRDGRRVFRQGDIFAVETDLTDDDMLNAGHQIVDRGVLMDGTQVRPFASTDRGYRLRKRLMIYGTGHTARQVCVTPRGTFVKGMLHHDPILENIRANRPPEHSAVDLGEEMWFLAVRNTVPRQTSSDSN